MVGNFAQTSADRDRMNADFLSVLEFWERESGIERGDLKTAVREALLSAAIKAIGPFRDLRVVVDRKTGDIRALARLRVVEEVVSKHQQIALIDARRTKPDTAVGEDLEVDITPGGFGQVVVPYVKEALTDRVRSELTNRSGKPPPHWSS
jgi:N utilization substance protein A